MKINECSVNLLIIILLVTVTGWYHTKHPMHCDHFLTYCVSPSDF
jgi:hypothetical protein